MILDIAGLSEQILQHLPSALWQEFSRFEEASQGSCTGSFIFDIHCFICHELKYISPCQQELQSNVFVGKMSCIETIYNIFSFEAGLVIQKLHMFLIKISVGLELGRICSYYPCCILPLQAVFSGFLHDHIRMKRPHENAALILTSCHLNC